MTSGGSTAATLTMPARSWKNLAFAFAFAFALEFTARSVPSLPCSRLLTLARRRRKPMPSGGHSDAATAAGENLFVHVAPTARNPFARGDMKTVRLAARQA